MHRIRSLLLIPILFHATLALSLEPAELSQILDAPELPFSVDNASSTLAKNEAVFQTGSSSLEVQPVFDDGEQRHIINLTLSFPAQGPGRFTCKASASDANLGLFSVNGFGAYELLPSNHTDNTWYELSFPVQPHSQQVDLTLSTFFENSDATFYFDDFRFEQGVVIETEAFPAAGSITLSPLKEIYSVGEKIQVSVQTTSSQISATSITELDYYTGAFTTRPSSYTLTAANDLTLRANYTQKTKVGALNATIELYDAIATADPATPFTAKSIILSNVPKNTLLTFDVEMLRYREVSVIGSNKEYPATPAFQSVNSDEGFQTYSYFIDQTESSLLVDVFTPRLAPDQHYFPFRNLQTTSKRQFNIATKGQGFVAASYLDDPAAKTAVATLEATPADGWEFVGWSGFATSEDSEIELKIDGPKAIIATFKQVFEFGASRWSFLPRGENAISLTDDETGLRILPGPKRPPQGFEATVFAAGTFDSTLYIIDADDDSIIRSYATFADSGDFETPPFSVSQTIFFGENEYAEIRNITAPIGDPANPALPFQVNAPAGAVKITPQKNVYYAGDVVTLSVNENWKDRFLGWYGTQRSSLDSLPLTLATATRIEALFQAQPVTRLDRSVRSQGSAIMQLNTNTDSISFLNTTLAPNQFTEIEIPVTPPLTIALAFTGRFPNLSRSYFLGQKDADDYVTTDSGEAVILKFPQSTTGPLRIRIENTSDEVATGALSVTGLYQDTRDWIPFGYSSRVQMTPTKGLIPVGQTVSVQAISPDESYTFDGWLDLNDTEAKLDIVVTEGRHIRLRPKFKAPNPVDGVVFIEDLHESWVQTGSNEFSDPNDYTAGSTHSIQMQVDGPGVLLFEELYTELDLTDLSVSVDGVDTLVAEYGISSDHKSEVLIPAGGHDVQILTSRTQYATDNDLQPRDHRISRMDFIPGYAVTGTPGIPHGARAVDQIPPPVFAPGTSLTIVPGYLTPAEFQDWSGTLSGSPQSVTLPITNHIVANGKQPNTVQVGDASVSISENAIFSAYVTTGLAASYFIEPASGTTTMQFSVPAWYEFTFSLTYADIPVTVSANGIPVYDGIPGEQTFTFPVKETSQSITLTLDIDPSYDQQIWVNDIFAHNEFQLYGDFGDRQEYVTADPSEDSYAPGAEVTIKLTDQAPANWVFYDLATYLPSLGIFEWIDNENTRSFDLEMASDIEVIGKVGPAPKRSSGDIVLSSNLTANPSAEKTPNGRSSRLIQLNDSELAYLRLYCPATRHVEFWIHAPKTLQLLSLDSSNMPFLIEGQSGWQQVSLPMPPGSDYLNLFVLINLPSEDSFLISDIRQQANLGIPFVSSPGGIITPSPTGGVNSPTKKITLTASPIDGYVHSSWGITQTALTPTISLSPVPGLFLTPQFTKLADRITVGDLDLEITGLSPRLEETNDSLWFEQNGTAVKLLITGPGRITYRTEFTSSNADLYTYLDGEQHFQHRLFPFGGNPSEAEIRIEEGIHTLEFKYSENSDTPSAGVYDLAFEKGVFLDTPNFPQGGLIHVSPDRRFFALGESVTLSATPEYDLVFDKWKGDISSQLNPTTFQITKHSFVDVDFRFGKVENENGMSWQIEADRSNPSIRCATTTVEGPGFFRIRSFIAESPKFATYLNGLYAPVQPTRSDSVLTIPSGKHRVTIKADGYLTTFAYDAPYTKGYLFDLSKNAEALTFSPIQKSYLLGSKVHVTLPSFTTTPALVENTTLQPGERLEYIVSDHTLVSANGLRPLGSDFQTSNEPGNIVFTNWIGNAESIVIQPLADKPSYLQKSFEGPGVLNLSIFDAEHASIDLIIDGAYATTLDSVSPQSFLIPARTTLVAWKINWQHIGWLTQPVVFDSLSFVPGEHDAYMTQIAQLIPTHLFALGKDLAPESDLDKDGRSNLKELNAGTPLHRFDTKLDIELLHSKNVPSLEFVLPAQTDPSRLSILRYSSEGQVNFWHSIPLSDVDYSTTPSGTSLRYLVPVDQFENDTNLYRLSIDSLW